MIFSVAYLLARRLLGCLMVLARREVSKDAELLIPRPENEHLGLERGHRTLTITRKGGKVVTIPLAPRTARRLTWPPAQAHRIASVEVLRGSTLPRKSCR